MSMRKLVLFLFVVGSVGGMRFMYRQSTPTNNHNPTTRMDDTLSMTPDTLATSLPKNSIMFRGDGVIFALFTFVVDFDHGTLVYYTGPNKNPVNTVSLPVSTLIKIKELAKKSVQSNFINQNMSNDLNFTLVLSQDSVIQKTQTQGALPTSGPMADLHRELYSHITP